MHLTRTILAVLLAVCVVAFPVAMPWAAASTVQVHAHETSSGHAHASSADHSSDAVDVVSGIDGRHEHASGGESGTAPAPCCGTVMCHAFQVSYPPVVVQRSPLTGPARVVQDQQVTWSLTDRLDRPPRTA